MPSIKVQDATKNVYNKTLVILNMRTNNTRIWKIA